MIYGSQGCKCITLVRHQTSRVKSYSVTAWDTKLISQYKGLLAVSDSFYDSVIHV
jgi:hypothetical protein